MNEPVFGEVPGESIAHPRRAAYLIATDELGRVAVVEGLKNGPRRYWLPGGGCKAGESPEQAVEREVAEELGRRVLGTHTFAEAVQVFYSEADQCWFRSNMAFLSGTLGNRLRRRPEHDLTWLDPARMTPAMYHSSHVGPWKQFFRL
jgi:8-oxo-dGTP pyrophosphatase MutT (NUDIX family)